MSEATIAQSTGTQAPAIICQLLEKLGLPYGIRHEQAGIAHAQRVQAVLLDDEVGALLVLFSQEQLLDLARLSELTGRKLRAVKRERLQRMLSKHCLRVLPGIPALTSSPCLYDENLLELPAVFLQSGEVGVLLELDSASFKKLVGSSSAARLAEPLSRVRPNLDRPHDDRAEITTAVQTFTARRIQQRLEESIEIPPLSETAQKIIKLRVDPLATVEDITAVIETDPALAAQVVSLAGSAYYATQVSVRSVRDAIVRVLGFDLVINLALGLCKTLNLPSDQPQQAAPYWQQAVYTAALIEGLAQAMPKPLRPVMGLTYLAGLLHDFGNLVLAHVFPPHFSLICRHLEVNTHLPHGYVEQYLLGINREQIGSWLMRHWDMPEELAIAIRFQYDPGYSGDYAVYPNLVFLAVSLLHNHGVVADPRREIPQYLLDKLGISLDQAEAALYKVVAADVALQDLAQRINTENP
jgi:HD-like signal output (HDOD) protein/prolyl-tRNA editing enzyme YbaK/EbsC (Cys-tRNA(Pro) deacylase)